jgi:hypothetical protein
MAKRLAAAAAAEMAMEGNRVALNAGSAATTRTTLVLPLALDQNLELFAVQKGLPKGEIIKRVLAEYLKKEGLQPDKRPRTISVAY